MEHSIGAGDCSLNSYLAGYWVEEGHDLSRSLANVFMGLAYGIAFWLPTMAWLRNGLVWAGLIFGPNGKSAGFSLMVSLGNEFFLTRRRDLLLGLCQICVFG
jgi:hypothetical protein